MTINYTNPPNGHISLRSFQEINTPCSPNATRVEFVVLSKDYNTGKYEEFACCSTTHEAWTARRTLADLNRERKFFLRAREVYSVVPASQEAREGCDLWREAFRTGRDELIPADQWKDYQCWVAKKVEARQAYARFDRDQPRWV